MKRTEKSEKIDPSTNSHSGPTILLTGGAGFIGTNFIRHLLAIRPRWRMVNLDALTYAGNAANLDNLAGHTSARYRLLHGDMLEGEIFDVAVDVRRGSPTFGQSAAVTLTAQSHRQLYIPQGFAHGFCVLSPTALFMYKCNDFYAPSHEGGLCWDDPDLDIAWPVENPILSERDRNFPRLRDIPNDRLPPDGG